MKLYLISWVFRLIVQGSVLSIFTTFMKKLIATEYFRHSELTAIPVCLSISSFISQSIHPPNLSPTHSSTQTQIWSNLSLVATAKMLSFLWTEYQDCFILISSSISSTTIGAEQDQRGAQSAQLAHLVSKIDPNLSCCFQIVNWEGTRQDKTLKIKMTQMKTLQKKISPGIILNFFIAVFV